MNNNNFRVNLYISSGISLLLCGVGGGERSVFCVRSVQSVTVLLWSLHSYKYLLILCGHYLT